MTIELKFRRSWPKLAGIFPVPTARQVNRWRHNLDSSCKGERDEAMFELGRYNHFIELDRKMRKGEKVDV